MRPSTRYVLAATTLAGSLWLAGCGDDDDATAADPALETDGDVGLEEDGGGEAGGGPVAGTLLFDGEEIELGPGRCFLEEQPAAAGGGSILATAQASGDTASGEEVTIDFTRFSEESQFAGDSVTVDVGPLGDSVGYRGSAPEGTVTIDENVVSATDFPLRNSDDGSEATATFTIGC